MATSYTAADVDAMRRTTYKLISLEAGRLSYFANSYGRQLRERKAEAEERLRTYLLAGVTPQQLEFQYAQRWQEIEKQREIRNARQMREDAETQQCQRDAELKSKPPWKLEKPDWFSGKFCGSPAVFFRGDYFVSPPSDSEANALANHLNETGYKFDRSRARYIDPS